MNPGTPRQYYGAALQYAGTALQYAGTTFLNAYESTMLVLVVVKPLARSRPPGLRG